MTDQAKTGPGWQAVMAGAVVLGTGPVALALLVLISPGGEEGGLGGVAALVNEGGAFSDVVLALGALGSLGAAVLAGLSVRRAALPAPLALVPFLLPVLAALAGVSSGMRGLLAAVAHVAPSDKGTILVAATAELSSLRIQALTFAGAGVLAVALAASLTLGAPGRAGRVLTVLGGTTLGLSLAAAALQSLSLRNGFSASAHSSPADRLTLLVGTIGDWQRFAHLSGALFLASLLVAAGGAAVLAARGQKAMGLGAASALLVAAVGFRGFNALTEQQLFSASREHQARPRPELMAFDGRHPLRGDFVALNSEDPAQIDAAVARACGRGDEHPWVALELRRGLSRASLLRALQTAHYLRTEVELIGGGPKRHLEAPAVFEAALAAVTELPQSAPVRVLFAGAPCERCAGVATATDTGLLVTSSAGEQVRWKQEAVPFYGEVDQLPGVELVWSQGEPEPLVRAALVALSHQHLLVVRVAPPEPPPTLPDY